MPKQDVILKKDWRPLIDRINNRIASVLASWEDTPYMALQSCKGRQGGVDCIRFVCGVADELYGYSRGPVISLPTDQSMHDRAGSMAAMREIKERYDPVDDVSHQGWIEPGDIMVTGPINGGPGHAMFVGARAGNIWESTAAGVKQCGMPAFGTQMTLFRIYRVRDKWRWVSG